MKKIIAILLTFATLLTFASCSGNKKKNQEPEKVALENVYLTQKVSLPEDVDIYNMYISGDNVYFKGSKNEHYVNEDGVEDYKYYEMIYRTDKSFSDFEEYFTFESENFYDEKTHENRSTYFNLALPDGHGGMWICISSYYGKPVDDTMSEWINENNSTLYHYDINKTLTKTIDCKEVFKTIPDIEKTELDQLYVNSVHQDADGTVYIMTGSRITAIGADGNVIRSNALDDNNNFNNMAVIGNGKLRVLRWDWSGDEGKQEIVDYDIATNECKTVCTLPTTKNIMMDAQGNVYTDDYYVISRVDLATGEEKPMLDWINSDINCDRVFNTTIQNDEIYTFEWDGEYEKRSLLHLTPASDGEAIEKYIITLAANSVDGELKNMIIDYNRSSLDYRIQVKVYGWEEGANEKFDMDILAGKVPDIICLDQLNAEKYASKGLLADLGALLDADDEISVEDFLPNVIEASKIKGKLYRIPANFSVRSLLGKTSIVGDRETWTWDDFIKVMREHPDSQMISEYDRKSLMSAFLSLIIEDFIDYDTGKSNFTDGNFAKFLEYAKTLPDEIDWNTFYEGIDDWEEYEKRYAQDKTLLMFAYLSNPNGNYYNVETFGEPVTYIGFPTASGDGNVLCFGNQFAIGEKSVYKEQAWDFLKMIFDEKYQDEHIWQFPVIKSVMDKKVEEAIADVAGIVDDDIYIDDDMVVMPKEEVAVVTANDIIGMPKPVLPVEDDENEEYRQRVKKNIEDVARLATSATHILRNNDPMIEVIASECAPYFDGKKSLEETCNIIESRVNLYLAENM